MRPLSFATVSTLGRAARTLDARPAAPKTQPLRLSYAFEASNVEKPGDHQPPTAFRIWRAGENRFDAYDGNDGSLVFSERSAKLVMDEQAARSRLYCFDYSHLSLISENPESGKAAGWHRLEVRPSEAGPELWAVSCAWTESAKKMISGEVPEFRYFSPAFSVDPETNEVISYTNCAITNNPRTHGLQLLNAEPPAQKTPEVPAKALLTSQRSMDLQSALAILLDPNSSPEDKQAAAQAIADLFGSLAAPAADPAPVEAAESPSQEDKPKPEEVAAALLASNYLKLAKKVEAMEVRSLLNGRVLPKEVAEWAAKQSPETVKSFLVTCGSAFRPAPNAPRNERPTVGESKPAGFVAPPIGQSPVDKGLRLSAEATGKPGLSATVDPITGSRKINAVRPSVVKAGKVGA